MAPIQMKITATNSQRAKVVLRADGHAKAGRAVMPASRINWGAIGTFLFVLFVLGVLAFEHMDAPPEATRTGATEMSDVTDVANANEATVRQ